jgi:putative membrane protein
MKRLMILGALVVAAAGCSHSEAMPPPNGESSAPTAALSGQDQDFVKAASMGGMFEVETGKLAAQKATNPDVKKFGEMMTNDHGAANARLAQVVQSKGIGTATSLDEDHQKMFADLNKLTGCEFDRQYLKTMLKGHEETVAKFETEEKGGDDKSVKEFAASTLPTIRSHLSLVRDLNAKSNCAATTPATP